MNSGEIWIVQFYPKVGSEIAKERPAIIVSHNQIGRLPLKTIVPITDWKSNYYDYPWMLKIQPNSLNNLEKNSAIDTFQVKNFAHSRFVKKIGKVDTILLKEVHTTIAKTFNPVYSLC
jgi:mRNA interferase MazF